MKTLTQDQAEALRAFLDAFDLCTTGAWPSIEKTMIEDFGIENPEEILEECRKALS